MSPSASPAVTPELCHVGLDADDAETALAAMAAAAHAAGYVDAAYAAALIERERAYPTGLPTPTPVALPHADPDHVVRAGLGVATFARPIAFGEMGGSGQVVEARAAIVLVLEGHHDRIELLTSLIDVVQRPDWFERLDACGDPAALAAALTALLEAPSA